LTGIKINDFQLNNSKSWQTIIPVSAVEISYRLANKLARSFSGERDAEISRGPLLRNIFFENFSVFRRNEVSNPVHRLYLV
jgi:hypothetical protein